MYVHFEHYVFGEHLVPIGPLLQLAVYTWQSTVVVDVDSIPLQSPDMFAIAVTSKYWMSDSIDNICLNSTE